MTNTTVNYPSKLESLKRGGRENTKTVPSRCVLEFNTCADF